MYIKKKPNNTVRNVIGLLEVREIGRKVGETFSSVNELNTTGPYFL